MNKIFRMALLNTFGTALYIFLVGIFIYYASIVKIGKASRFLAPIAMLLLFVSSAAITSYLVFGKPAILYLDGKKKDALTLIIYTLSALSVITILVLVVLIALNFK